MGVYCIKHNETCIPCDRQKAMHHTKHPKAHLKLKEECDEPGHDEADKDQQEECN